MARRSSIVWVMSASICKRVGNIQMKDRPLYRGTLRSSVEHFPAAAWSCHHIQGTALFSIHILSALDRANDVIPLAEKGYPIIQCLLLGFRQILPLRHAILGF